MAGLLDQAKQWMTPERGIAFQGIGMGLSQLGAGQAVDLSPAYAALDARKQSQKMRQVMDTPGMMDGFTPQQRAILAQMPESMAVELLMQNAFAPPPEPVRGIEVGGQVVDPITGRVIYEGQPEQPEPMTTQTTLGQLAQERGMPLPAGVDPNTMVNVAPDGEIKPVVSGGTTITNNLGPNGTDYGDPGSGLVWQRDPENNIMMDERGAPIAIPFQGGAVWNEQQAEVDKAAGLAEVGEVRQGQRDTATEVITTSAARAREATEKGFMDSGLVGNAIAAANPGSWAAEKRRQTAVLTANASIENITKMREASPTGAALGAASDRDMATLAAKTGALDAAANDEQFKRALDDYERTLLQIVHGYGPGNTIFEETRPQQPGPPDFNAMPEVTDLAKRYGVTPQDIWDAMSEEDRKEFAQ